MNGITPGANTTVLAGSWDYSGDTFISTGGTYSLGYILNKYNAFIANNLTGTHIVGPVVVGGDAAVSLGGSTTDVDYPHDAPTYTGTYSYTSGTIITLSDVPAYFSPNAMGKEYVLQGAAGNYYDYYFASQFIDFPSAMGILQSEAASFSGQAVEQNGETVALNMGGRYEFTAEQLSAIQNLNFLGRFGMAAIPSYCKGFC